MTEEQLEDQVPDPQEMYELRIYDLETQLRQESEAKRSIARYAEQLQDRLKDSEQWKAAYLRELTALKEKLAELSK